MRRWLLGGLLLLAPCAWWAAAAQGPAPVVPATHVEPAPKGRDLAKLTPQRRAYYLAAHRGMDWLRRTNKQDGRFVYGFLPDLRAAIDDDRFIAQAGAAFALARAARFLGDETALAISRQALLTLLLETTPDPKDAAIRHTTAPPQLLNRLAGHGQLVVAIHTLPTPGKDLLDQGDQLCNYVRLQQRADGALLVAEPGQDASAAMRDDALASAGLALQGLARSQKLRPAPWKLDTVRKASAFAQACWQQKKSLALALSHTPAWADAYLLTQDPVYASLVFATNDWLCGLQYEPGEPVRATWIGGFRPCVDGQAMLGAPDVHSAEVAESLGEACRVARAAGDLPRLQRYTRVLENSLQFLLTLQYTEARAQHFVESYRPALVGAFHASHQDGKIRIDYAQHALAALVLYLEQD